MGSTTGIVGGIVGFGSNVIINNCYFAGNLIVFYEAAGIVANDNNVNVKGCVVLCNAEIVANNPKMRFGYYITYPYNYYRDPNAILENNYILEDVYLKFKDYPNELYYIPENDFIGSVISTSEITSQSFYESIGWDFSEDNPTWEFTEDYMLPKLVGVGGQEDLVTPKHLL